MGVPRKITRFKQKEIRDFYKKAKLVYTDSSMRIHQAHAAGTPAKLLIIIPKKTGNAPHRNRLRRRIKEVFAQLEMQGKGYDYRIRFAPIKHPQDISFAHLHAIMAAIPTDEKINQSPS